MKQTLLFMLLLLSAGGPAIGQQISGTVTDDLGDPLVGATVIIHGTVTGTYTDDQGQFVLEVPSLNDSITVSYFGYERQIIPLRGQTVFSITMEIAQFSTEEFVVVGYGRVRKSDLTGSVSQIDVTEVGKIPNGSISQLLQGKAAGVQVTPASGAPGAGAVIRIRGVGTLNNASPLFVVDGMLLDDIDFLNPNDIESIEVLKDASATAIYGSRGANGVVIITTKNGTSGDSRITVQAYEGFQDVIRTIDLANANEYALLSNELAVNEGRDPVFADPSSYGEGTDWQDVIFERAAIRNYQLAFSGGTENMSYRVSGDYFNQNGIIRDGSFERISLRMNNEYRVKPYLTLGHNLGLIYSRRITEPGILGNAYRADPTIAPFDSLGEFSNTTVNAPVGNAEASIFYNNNKSFSYRAIGNVFASLNFLKHFTLRTSLGVDVQAGFFKTFVPVFFVSPIQQNEESRLTAGLDRTQNILWENTLSYVREWTDQRLSVVGGVTSQAFVFENLGGSRINFPGETDEFFFLNAGEIDGQTNYNSSFEWAMLSYLTRVNYSYRDRYLLTASIRRDGSSRFGQDNQYGLFPSLAMGWNVAEEVFWNPVKAINRLKFRGSWGVIGNDKIGAYPSTQVVTQNLNAVFGPDELLNTGASIITSANPGIRWEETVQLDIGMEFGAFADRISGEIDYYQRTTNDILVAVPIPAYVGSANDPTINAATVRNSGIDLALTWRELLGHWGYRVTGMLSTVRNEVIELGEGNEEIFGGGLGVGGLLGTRTVPGLPIGAFYGYEVEGVFQTQEEIDNSPNRGVEVPGDLKFADIDGDGFITTEDRTYLGSPIPTLIYNTDLEVTYKGLALSVSIYGQHGNKVVNAKKMARFGTPNFEASYLDRWTGEGTSNTEPRITNGGHNYEPSERFLEDGAFTRIRNIQLAYDLPANIVEKLRMDEVQVYVSGTNLFTWQSYSGYTPEVTTGSVIAVGIDQGIYPLAKVWTTGLNLQF